MNLIAIIYESNYCIAKNLQMSRYLVTNVSKVVWASEAHKHIRYRSGLFRFGFCGI